MLGVERRDLARRRCEVGGRRAAASQIAREPVGVADRLAVRRGLAVARRSCVAAAPPAARPSSGAQRPRMSSITIMPCGPPKPRKAVWDVLLVLAIRPLTRMFGIQ